MILEKMSSELSLPPNYIALLVRTASHQYKTYEIAKRTGGTRTILHPSKRLKALQRWLLANVVDTWPVHPAAAAYRKGKTIFDNAKTHAKSNYLLRMDIKTFFPSLMVQDMREYAIKRPHLFTSWNGDDFESFCRLVFRDGRLAIGAPTSPSISNALCFDLDVGISGICQSHGVEYTRYADDFSSLHAREVSWPRCRMKSKRWSSVPCCPEDFRSTRLRQGTARSVALDE